MADKKISALTGATTPLAGTEVLPIVQGGATVNVSVANLTAGRAVAMAGGSFTDNITQSTAAKGINFTANTPAAGMTSQLLNAYEEGTFNATVTSGAGLITSYTAAGTYVKVGKEITVQIAINITNAGTASGLLVFANLPFTSQNVSGSAYVGRTRESNVSGAAFDFLIDSNATTGLILSSVWASGQLYSLTATYITA
jgi:hypothetical protein